MINSERPWETSTERQVINVGDFSDRVRWDAFLGLAASREVAAHCHRHCSTCVAQGVRAMRT